MLVSKHCVQGQLSDVRDLNGPDDLEDELDPRLDQLSDDLDALSELGVLGRGTGRRRPHER